MYIRVPNRITDGSTATIPLYTPVPVAVPPLPPALAALYQVAYTVIVVAQSGDAGPSTAAGAGTGAGAGAGPGAAGSSVPTDMISIVGWTTVSESSSRATSWPLKRLMRYSWRT